MFTRKYTDEIYKKYWEPGFEWMSEEGFYKAVHVIAKDLAESGVEASDCFLAEVGRNEVLKKQLIEAVRLVQEARIVYINAGYHSENPWLKQFDDFLAFNHKVQ